ncbi:uncharacterized protein CXorf49 homolog [Ochotona princeps]|uniref:uncharacterized protein CXorf49 homolog n=1 Tax=Ochotona princeps TaxID=9978 RepID=UPI00271500C7|nr:uncharacterized protein CXorf49 homolog [Ochotona princeps]
MAAAPAAVSVWLCLPSRFLDITLCIFMEEEGPAFILPSVPRPKSEPGEWISAEDLLYVNISHCCGNCTVEKAEAPKSGCPCRGGARTPESGSRRGESATLVLHHLIGLRPLSHDSNLAARPAPSSLLVGTSRGQSQRVDADWPAGDQREVRFVSWNVRGKSRVRRGGSGSNTASSFLTHASHLYFLKARDQVDRLPFAGLVQTCGMSSHRKASDFRGGNDPKTEEPAGLTDPRAPWAQSLGTYFGQGQGQRPRLAESGSDEGPSRPQARKWQWDLESRSESQLETTQEGTEVLWGCQARPNTPTSEGQGAVDPVAQLAEACAAILCVSAAHRFQSTESGASDKAFIWSGVKAGSSSRGPLGRSDEESRQACAAAWHRGVCTKRQSHSPCEGRGAKRRLIFDTDGQSACGETLPQPLSDSESSDELMDTNPVRVSIHEQEDQAKDSSSEELPESPRRCTAHSKAKVPPISGPVLTSTLQGPTWTTERQAVGELGPFSSKKMKSVVLREGGESPTHPEVAAAGGLPRGTFKRKAVKVKASLEDSPEVVLGSAFAPWGRGPSEASVYPDTFPKISGISLLEKRSPSSSFPLAPEQSKLGDLGKQSPVSRTSQTVAAGDGGPNRDPDSRAGLPTNKSAILCWYMHHAEFKRGHQDLENSEPLSLSQDSVTLQGPLLSATTVRSQSDTLAYTAGLGGLAQKGWWIGTPWKSGFNRQ